jgi:GAF domain-containing protein
MPVLVRIAERSVVELDVDEAAIAAVAGKRTWTRAHATGAAAAALEQYAFTTGEGPSADVVRDESPVAEPDLDSPAAGRRWPTWTPAAQEAGIRSVAAFPIRAGAVTAGALTLYSRTPGAFDRKRYEAALRLADLAFLGLLDVMAGLKRTEADGAPAPGDLLRADVHRAAGMIMAQAGIPIDQALARLRAYAYSTDRPLSEVATDVLERRLRFAADGTSAE